MQNIELEESNDFEIKKGVFKDEDERLSEYIFHLRKNPQKMNILTHKLKKPDVFSRNLSSEEIDKKASCIFIYSLMKGKNKK